MNDQSLMVPAVEACDPESAEKLQPLVYDELRRVAAHRMALQPAGHTLQATALVHEAFVRLVGNAEHTWADRRHFFAAASEAMRHVLVDRARRKAAVRHGSNHESLPWEDVMIEADSPVEAFARAGAFPLLKNSADCAMSATLSPGAYTAQVRSADSSSGIAVVEIYEVP